MKMTGVTAYGSGSFCALQTTLYANDIGIADVFRVKAGAFAFYGNLPGLFGA